MAKSKKTDPPPVTLLLRAARIAAGISLYQAGNYLGVHYNVIYRYECGLEVPSKQHLARLERLYKTPDKPTKKTESLPETEA